MRLESLTLTNYRNISTASLEIHPRLTILLGQNGVGKTNVLESIHLLSFPRSFRSRKDELLKQWETDYCRVEGIIERDSTSRSLVYFYDKSKKLQVDGRNTSSIEYVGQFLSVLFAPEEVDLLSSSPSRRRGFLDAHLSLLSPTYLHHLLNYNKVLKQRNKLLSMPQIDPNELLYWNEQQVAHGAAIIEARINGVTALNAELFPEYNLHYTSPLINESEGIAETFQQKQAAMLKREQAVGHSLLGPHRDDWTFEELVPAVRDLGVYGSRGEQRMAVIALKQAELTVVHKKTGERAVLLLDDVLSELDADHQAELLSSLGQQQTILTTASLTDVPDSLLQDATIYTVNDGVVST